MCSLNGNFYVKEQIYLILSLIVLMLFKRDIFWQKGGCYTYTKLPQETGDGFSRGMAE